VNLFIKCLFLLLLANPALVTLPTAREDPDTNSVYYQGEVYFYTMEAPEGWILKLQEEDSPYAAVISPDTQDAGTGLPSIYIGIYKNLSRSFRDFISADSAYIVKQDQENKLEFIRSDTLFNSEGRETIIFETEDPGGRHNLAVIAYIDAGTETVVYELQITERLQFREAESKFREALSCFSMAKNK
jgi:hypothetical protein